MAQEKLRNLPNIIQKSVSDGGELLNNDYCFYNKSKVCFLKKKSENTRKYEEKLSLLVTHQQRVPINFENI